MTKDETKDEKPINHIAYIERIIEEYREKYKTKPRYLIVSHGIVKRLRCESGYSDWHRSYTHFNYRPFDSFNGVPILIPKSGGNTYAVFGESNQLINGEYIELI